MILTEWLIPVLGIPAIWPAYAVSVGEFEEWYAGVLYQTHRTSKALTDSFVQLMASDPVLTIFSPISLIASIFTCTQNI